MVEVRCRLRLESARPNEVTLSLDLGSGESGAIELRCAMATEGKRSVVTAKSTRGCRVQAGDYMVAIDRTLFAPPPQARGLHMLLDRCISQLAGREVTLLFARAKEDVVYTITLPSMPSTRGSSWRGSRVFSTQGVTEKWRLELERDPNGLLVVQSSVMAARQRDVVVVLGSQGVARMSVVSFGLAADEAVEAAATAGRASIPLTLVVPDLVAKRPDIFLEEVPKGDAKQPSAIANPEVATARQTKGHDVESGTIHDDVLREMQPAERRKLAQLHRLLRQGTGAELHTMRESMPRVNEVVLRDLDDFKGLEVVPVVNSRGLPVINIFFDDIVGVEMPMPAKYSVGSTTLAASLTLAYRTGGVTRSVDLSFADCPALACAIAQGLLAAHQQQETARCALNTRVHEAERLDLEEDQLQHRRSSWRPSSAVFRQFASQPALRPSSTVRPRATSGDAPNARTRTSHLSAALMLADDATRSWWRKLSPGVIVQVMYAQDTYAVRTPLGEVSLNASQTTLAIKRSPTRRPLSPRLNMSSPRRSPNHGEAIVFAEGQYCRAIVKRAVRARRGDRRTTRYVLAYLDGPYDADVSAFSRQRVTAFPKGTLFVGVPRAVIVVTFDDQHRYWPLAMLLLSGLQITAFLFYARRKPGGLNNVAAGSPVVGPSWLHYGLFSSFPQCEDRRKQIWRLFTYQFAHIGYSHLASNLFVQLVFGIPVELVHGHTIVFAIYQLGVALGALTCAFSDIHKSVVGASGGVYTLVGLHTADCLVNWKAIRQDSRMLLRALLCLVVPGLDIIIYALLYYRDDTTSYAAHIGGYIAGLLLGASFLRPLQDNAFSSFFVKPIAIILLILFVSFAVAWYQLTWPPKYFLNGPFWRRSSYTTNDHSGSCCWQLLDCSDIDEDDYQLFSCNEGTTIYPGRYNIDEGLNPLHTCSQLLEYLASDLAQEARNLLDD